MKHYRTLLPTYLKGLVSGKYTLQQASESTGYSKTWLCILKQKYLKQGFECLEHHNKNRVPAIAKPKELREKIAFIYADKYKDVNFQFFRRCLAEFENIKISYSTLRSILKAYGLVSPEAHKIKRKNKAKRPRIRRENFGDMIQIDGTPFQWFYKFGNTKRYCLVGAIDDATSRITGLYMTEYECFYGYCEILRQTIKRHGIPREIYSDRAAIFCVTPKNKQNLTQWEQLEGLHDKKTQWQRVLDDLKIHQILAWSPEAKGRVERMWKTIQGELPQLFFLNNIKTVEQANKYLEKIYIDKFNANFSVEPARGDTFFLENDKNLDDILCAKIPRKTDKDGCISFHGYKFHIENCPLVSYRHCLLCISERGLFVRFENDTNYYPVQILDVFQRELSDTMPQVVENIIYRYMFAYAKEISA